MTSLPPISFPSIVTLQVIFLLILSLTGNNPFGTDFSDSDDTNNDDDEEDEEEDGQSVSHNAH